jgi:hypothetical protein
MEFASILVMLIRAPALAGPLLLSNDAGTSNEWSPSTLVMKNENSST